MAKRRKKAGNPITPLLLILSLFISILGVYSYIQFRPVGPAQIFVIEPLALAEGYVELSGTLIKDVPEGVSGTYLLILSDNSIISLNIQDVDLLLGESVVVEGILTLPTNDSEPPHMIVNSISTN